MAYTSINYKNKKSLKDAVKAGKRISVYSCGLENIPQNGTVYLSGPHSPAPHTWYGQATLKDGIIVAVK